MVKRKFVIHHGIVSVPPHGTTPPTIREWDIVSTHYLIDDIEVTKEEFDKQSNIGVGQDISIG